MNYNLTPNVVLKQEILSGDLIIKALKKTIDVYLSFYDLKVHEIPFLFNGTIFRKSEKRNALLVYHFLNNFIKEESFSDSFNISFINLCLEINQLKESELLHSKINGIFNLSYGKDYSSPLRGALSVFLLILHLDKVIGLPFNFNIPYSLNKEENGEKVDLLNDHYPPLFKVLRNIKIRNNNDEDSKIMGLKNKELLMSYGSKLLLSLGWINFEDIDLKELLNFNNELKSIDMKRFKCSPPISLMITFFNSKFTEFPISVNDWKELLTQSSKEIKLEKITSVPIKKKTLDFQSINSLINEDSDVMFFSSLDKVSKCFSVDNLERLKTELVEYSAVIDKWIILEKSYMSKRKLENYSTLKNALSYLNLYLFLALPRWFNNNKSKVKYPQNANELKAGLFISKIIHSEDIMPITLLEFLEEIKNVKNLSNESVYITLKNLETFFDFLQIYADELPGCKEFTQPISSLDFPKVAKSKGTNKGLIPRYLFGTLVSYLETIKEYNQYILDKVLTEEISADVFKRKGNFYQKYIDTISFQDVVGFVPMLYVNGEPFILKDIPNLLNIKSVNLKDGRELEIPHPHLINHILIVLQTGIRNNHIQWLDAETYKSALSINDINTFVPLYVNTDKSKTSAWTPIVNRKVIDILDEQVAWRNLIDNPAFNEKKFYNNNPKTKWGKFYPVFSYTKDGLPYSDTSYYDAWLNILEFFEMFVSKTSLKAITLGRRLPKGITVNDFNLDLKLKDYGASCDNFCELRWISDISPHSARVSVVSHYITALPADIIGNYVTGQTEAVVHHYVKLDPDYLTEMESGQKDALSKLAIQKEFNQLLGKEKSHHVLVNRESSNIAQSIAINKSETIAQYGCVSLNLKEGGKSGIDILIEESNIKLAFNKTEICPYNNVCPSDLLKELKGIKRCGLCPFAIRSIDHLPAIAVKKRQMMELLKDIENKLDEACLNQDKYTLNEIDAIEEDRQRITEELLGWIVSEEILEINRKRLQAENGKVSYLVKKPEILIANLQQVSVKENDVEYLLTRLADCESYPDLETPMVRAKIDLLRRNLLAKLGDFKGAFDMKMPQNPIQECAGVIKEIVRCYSLTKEQVVDILSTNVLSLNHKNESLLGINYEN